MDKELNQLFEEYKSVIIRKIEEGIQKIILVFSSHSKCQAFNPH